MQAGSITAFSISSPLASSRSIRWALRLSVAGAIGLIALASHAPADAVPSFTDQTGQPCQACHVGGFGPQLTPFGREFKLNGYTMRAKAGIPVSAMAVASFTHTKADQNPPTPGFDPNDNFAFDQGSVFIAGGVGKHLGGFAQITYDGIAKQWHWDNLDVRAVTTGKVLGQDAVFGLALNNAPTVQDVWNSTPAWGFPYTGSALAPAPAAAPLLNGGLAQSTLGVSAYTSIAKKVYLEAGAYTTPSGGTLSWLGVDPNGAGSIHGLAPYGRLALQSDLGGGDAHIGLVALKAAIYPGRDASSGYADHFTDLGLDASWQKALGSGDILAVQGRWVHERQNLLASCALGAIGDGSTIDCGHASLSDLRGDVSYYWKNKLGLTLGGFRTTGSPSATLYSGNASFKPDSNGILAQLDYTPWGAGNSPLGPRFNMRMGVQYTAFWKFNGQRHNWDGNGANAADNNAVRVFTWVAF